MSASLPGEKLTIATHGLLFNQGVSSRPPGRSCHACTGVASMTHINTKLRQFLTSEDGPTAVEYAVMLALIIVVCLVAISQLGSNAQTTFTNVANSIAS
jgi:pilus assembly protein Flp/PilA